ncbi:MAG: ribosome-associated translation inhibitor RaiA [Ignavibacteriae bacterium]|nr:ribosome-associated translation inhibitor RaiA [Ignavibacteriota bacterium]
MNVQITSRKFRAKETLKSDIKARLETLEKYNADILDASVILSYTHQKDSIKMVEVNLNVPGKVFTAKEEDDEYSKALTKVISKLERQLKKLKSKRISKTR